MSVMGIVILAVCAIGIYSVLRWVFRQVSALFGKHLVKQPGRQQKPKKRKFVRIGYERKLVCFDDLPEANKYKGRTWLGGLPVLADVVMPDKHDYSTIIYMDHWFKQYVYDVMIDFTGKWNPEAVAYRLLILVALLIAFNPVAVLIFTGMFYLWSIFWFTSAVYRGERRRGEKTKNFTPEMWMKIAYEIDAEMAQEESLVRALRKSGMGGWHWW